ncbi:MAG: OB-fold nucleic acid binding domain-containing protein [Candidatus Thorarchaeota archaeon]
MSDTLNYQFFPAINCWVKHLQEGKYNVQNNSLITIFGGIKRVRIVATLIEKEEFISRKSLDDEDSLEGTNINHRFILDDGTGLIYAIKWIDSNRTPNRIQSTNLYKNLKKGDLVSISGKINSWNNKIQISVENVNKITNPNYSLLNDARIIKKIKTRSLNKIPTDFGKTSNEQDSLDTEEEFLFDTVSDDFDIDELFTDKKSSQTNILKENIYSIIEQYSQKGEGISFNELKSKINLNEKELRSLINDLVVESRIYEPVEDRYQSY